AVVGGGLVTPRAVACPEGITRGTVLELAPAAGIRVAERDVALVELYTADEVFCTGTMGEIAGVVQIDGRPVGDGSVGPVTGRVAQHVGGVHDRPAEGPEQLHLLPVPEIGRGRFAAYPGVGGDHVRRVADEVPVPQPAQPVPAHLGQQVVGHVLLVVQVGAVRYRTGQRGGHVL